jgi:hypothetical protein
MDNWHTAYIEKWTPMVGLISNKRIIQKGKQHDKWLEQQIQI